MGSHLFESSATVGESVLRSSAKSEFQEPLGIVIADGGRGESVSQLSAFVWGPVPDEIEEDEDLTPFTDAAIAGVS